MRRTRTVLAALTTIALSGALALSGAGAAQAAVTGHWGAFTVSGTSGGYQGTMSLPGFPATTFTSNSRQATVISGASTWQGTGTGPGSVYGSSRGQSYVNQRPQADRAGAPAVTTYTFADDTPASGWSFVLGDIDADSATITATDAGGALVPVSALGFRSAYNSCSTVAAGGWSCSTTDVDPQPGSDVPVWDPATGTLRGNVVDTSGASAWFSPTVALSSLTISFERRAGFPIYQTWFADTTAAITGTATIDGDDLRGATVTATSAQGVVTTTTTDENGAYVFPTLVRTDGYVVAVTAPPGSTGASSSTVSTTAGDAVADFAFAAPAQTVSITGDVVDSSGAPAAALPVTATVPGGQPVTTVTNDDGVYVFSGLPPDADVSVAVADLPPVTVTTGGVGQDTVVVPTQTIPDAAVAVVSGTVRVNDQGVSGVTVELVADSGTVVASTTTDADGTYAFAPGPRSPYTVRVVPPGGATGTTSLPADATAGDVQVDFALTATPPIVTDRTVSGTVRLDGAAVADSVVTLSAADGTPLDTQTTGADGSYSFTLLERAVFSVSALAPTGSTGTTTLPADATAADATGVDFVFTTPAAPVSTVSGSVELDGAALTGRTVDLLDGDGAVVASTTTGPDGTYVFADEPRAGYRVRVVAPDGTTGATTRAADATAGDVSGVDFAFTTVPEATVSLAGTVADQTGAPVADQVVTATPTDETVAETVDTTTAQDGTFTLEGLVPSTEYVVATDGATPQTITTPATGVGEALTFVVSAAGTPTPAPTPTPTPTPVPAPGPTPVPPAFGGAPAATGALAFTGSNAAPVVIGGGLLVLLGAAFLIARGIRTRRSRDHLRD